MKKRKDFGRYCNFDTVEARFSVRKSCSTRCFNRICRPRSLGKWKSSLSAATCMWSRPSSMQQHGNTFFSTRHFEVRDTIYESKCRVPWYHGIKCGSDVWKLSILHWKTQPQVFHNIPEFSEHSVNTARVKTHARVMTHVEGGWPKEIDYSEAQDTLKYRKRLEKEGLMKNASTCWNRRWDEGCWCLSLRILRTLARWDSSPNRPSLVWRWLSDIWLAWGSLVEPSFDVGVFVDSYCRWGYGYMGRSWGFLQEQHHWPLWDLLSRGRTGPHAGDSEFEDHRTFQGLGVANTY